MRPDERPPTGIEVELIDAGAKAPGYRDAGASPHPPSFRIRCRRYVQPFTQLGIVIFVGLAIGWGALVVAMLDRGGRSGSPMFLGCLSAGFAAMFAWLMLVLVARLVNVRTIEQRDGVLRAWSAPLWSPEEAARVEIPIARIKAVGCARQTVEVSRSRGRSRYATFFLVFARSAKKKGTRPERWVLAHRLTDASEASYVARALRERLGGERRYEEEL